MSDQSVNHVSDLVLPKSISYPLIGHGDVWEVTQSIFRAGLGLYILEEKGENLNREDERS